MLDRSPLAETCHCLKGCMHCEQLASWQTTWHAREVSFLLAAASFLAVLWRGSERVHMSDLRRPNPRELVGFLGIRRPESSPFQILGAFWFSPIRARKCRRLSWREPPKRGKTITTASSRRRSSMSIGVLFDCFGRKIDGPGLPGGSIIYQGHPFSQKGHLCL